jgi:hypothetical protein
VLHFHLQLRLHKTEEHREHQTMKIQPKSRRQRQDLKHMIYN